MVPSTGTGYKRRTRMKTISLHFQPSAGMTLIFNTYGTRTFNGSITYGEILIPAFIFRCVRSTRICSAFARYPAFYWCRRAHRGERLQHMTSAFSRRHQHSTSAITRNPSSRGAENTLRPIRIIRRILLEVRTRFVRFELFSIFESCTGGRFTSEPTLSVSIHVPRSRPTSSMVVLVVCINSKTHAPTLETEYKV